MSLTIVIPVLNPDDGFIELIESLCNDDFVRANRVDVLIVDNGTTNQDLEGTLSDYPICRYARYAVKKSPYAARNFGTEQSTSEFVLHLDAKCYPQTGCIAALHGCIIESGADVVAGPKIVSLSDENDPYQYVSALTVPVVADDVSRGGAPGGCLLFRRSAFETYGLFDEDTRSNGDTLWFWQASKKGMRIAYCANGTVVYRAKGRISILSQALRIGGGRRYLAKATGRSRRWEIGSALWNLRPPLPGEVSSKLQKRDFTISGALFWKIYLAYYHYFFNLHLTRLGIGKITHAKSD